LRKFSGKTTRIRNDSLDPSEGRPGEKRANDIVWGGKKKRKRKASVELRMPEKEGKTEPLGGPEVKGKWNLLRWREKKRREKGK